ncbi:hypothetical protein KXR87_03120, partial [Yokenella regensburgei]|uniref:hypothetical protein n=1 Tax=Yokenella regensburgei TaxID=158877 RepID=UPI003F14C91C
MRLLWSFRSPYVPCFSLASEPVNVPGWFTATTLATRAPGKENRRFAALFAPSLGLTLSGLAQALFKIA